MGSGDHASQPTAADLEALRLRVDRLEQELTALRQAQPAAMNVSPLPVAVRPASPETPLQGAPPPPFSARPVEPQVSLENRIGSQVFSRISIVALLCGAAFGLKLAVDNHWIGPLGRILIGLIAGAGVILWSERFRQQGIRVFAYSLKAVGTGVLYLSLWAAFQLYHLLPAPVALAAMLLVTAWNAFMAWSQSAELLAAYALIGGFATPVLLSTGGDHQIPLFSYLFVLDLATVVLLRFRAWPRLVVLAWLPTTIYYFAWFAFARVDSDPISVTILFLALFFAAFASVSLATSGKSFITFDVAMPLANALFTATALVLLLTGGHHEALPGVSVLLAAIYLGFLRISRSTAAAAVHLTLAVLFLTLAIPLKAHGEWIVVGWLVEGAALLWASARLSHGASEALTVRVLYGLAGTALLLGIVGVLTLYIEGGAPNAAAFFNTNFATAMIAVVILSVAIALSLREYRGKTKTLLPWLQTAGASTIALNVIAIFACIEEIAGLLRPRTGSINADLKLALAISAFLMLYSAALLVVGFWRRIAFVRWQGLGLLVMTIAKTFLYDMRDLSQGYRVVSFLGLGVLLMAVSFAYQKDWLGLRSPSATSTEEHL